MKNAFYMILIKFAEEVGMKPQIDDVTLALAIAFLAIAFLLCFLGVKFFRVISAIMSFLMVGVLLLLLMTAAQRGAVVTAFVIIGLLLAAITFKWYRLGAFIVCVYIGFSFGAMIFNAFWINLLIGIALGILANIFPLITLIALTSMWGGLYFAIEGLNLLNTNLPAYLSVLIGIIIASLGAFTQYNIVKKLLDLPLKERRKKIFA